MVLHQWTRQLGLATLLVAACGSDGDGKVAVNTTAGASADGKVGNSDPDTIISPLNDAEYTAACLDLGKSLSQPKYAHGPCILLGLLSSFGGTSCMDTYETCLEDPGEESCDDGGQKDCEVTLRQMDACMISELEFMAKHTKDLDCSSSPDAFNQLEASKADEVKETPECDIVRKNCPSFNMDDMGGF